MGLGGWEGGSRGRGYGDVCLHMADSLCCATETNSIVKQLYSSKDLLKKKSNLGLEPVQELVAEILNFTISLCF